MRHHGDDTLCKNSLISRRCIAAGRSAKCLGLTELNLSTLNESAKFDSLSAIETFHLESSNETHSLSSQNRHRLVKREGKHFKDFKILLR